MIQEQSLPKPRKLENLMLCNTRPCKPDFIDRNYCFRVSGQTFSFARGVFNHCGYMHDVVLPAVQWNTRPAILFVERLSFSRSFRTIGRPIVEDFSFVGRLGCPLLEGSSVTDPVGCWLIEVILYDAHQ